MSFPVDTKERHIIPRWRDSRTTAALGELDSLRPKSAEAVDDGLVEAKALEWAGNRTVSFASDLLATALSSGVHHPSGEDAANYLLASDDASAAAKVVARRFLGLSIPGTDLLELYPQTKGSVPVEEHHQRIHDLKTQLVESPRNVLLRADLALEYTAVGRRDKAITMMERAVHLAPDNRFLLRSAARLLVHVKDPEAALDILRRSAVGKHDPWLMAAEVAISGLAYHGSRFAKSGSQAVSGQRFSSFHTTELASALGTLEAESGARKKAKRLFRQSLIAPTENSVAQATWAAQRLDFDEFDRQLLTLPGSFEARALEARHSGDMHAAIGETWKWLGDQFFAPSAAIFGSYLASVALDDHVEALRFVDVGQVANQNEWLLLNNRAFALASLNRIAEAEEILASLPITADVVRAATVHATKGLILFRKGLYWAGRELYIAAANAFDHANERRAAALAKLFQAREEILANTDEAEGALKDAREAMEVLQDAPEALLAFQRVEQAFEASRALRIR